MCTHCVEKYDLIGTSACNGKWDYQELKEHPATRTWFKDHLKVFTETSQSSLQDVSVSEANKTSFLS